MPPIALFDSRPRIRRAHTAKPVARHTLIVGSNRGPVSFELDADGLPQPKHGGGGLVTALSGVAHHHDVTWVAHAMGDGDVATQRSADGSAFRQTARGGAPYNLRLVAEPDKAYDLYYNRLANPLLWFVLHRLYAFGWDPTIDRDTYAAFDAYRTVNERMGVALADEAVRAQDASNSRPVVMVHDYHLFLVPGVVRARAGAAPIIHFFLHVPWPAPGAWRCLPRSWVREFVESLLACDIVGLQTVSDVQGFLLSVRDLVPDAEIDFASARIQWRGHEVRLRAYPISVNAEEFAEHAGAAATLRKRKQIAALRPDEGSLIVRVDRTDPSKNILRGMAAYELLLDTHPEFVGTVAMFCQLDPSRQGIDEYARYAEQILEAVARINARFATGDWQPLYLNLDSDFHAAVAAYAEYDVLFVNPVADGMNLVSKEGPLVNDRDGVVVLSEQAGSFSEIGEHVVAVNPFDIVQGAEALHAALTMPRAQRAKMGAALREQVATHDVRLWIDTQLADIDDVLRAT